MNHPEIVHEFKKGVGLVALTLALIAIVFAILPSRALGTTFVPEFLAVVALIISFQAWAGRMSQARYALARTEAENGNWSEVVGLLEPFLGRSLLWPNARIDKSGEALWLLVQAYEKTQRIREGKVVALYIARYRRGEIAAQASRWLELH